MESEVSIAIRPLEWVSAAKRDLKKMPPDVQDQFGHELFLVQVGEKPDSAEPLKGLGARVLELVEDHDGDTYRAVYTVRFEGAVYVLHCFQKKSRRGIATSRQDIALITARLKDAEAHHAQKYGDKAKEVE